MRSCIDMYTYLYLLTTFGPQQFTDPHQPLFSPGTYYLSAHPLAHRHPPPAADLMRHRIFVHGRRLFDLSLRGDDSCVGQVLAVAMTGQGRIGRVGTG